MKDLLGDGMAWLAGKQRQHAAIEIYYQRGESAVKLAATRGRSDFTGSDADGVTVTVNTQDFIVTATDLELDGVPIMPAPGDRIIIGELDNGAVYEVRRVFDNEPYRLIDHDAAYRIFTVYVGRIPPAP